MTRELDRRQEGCRKTSLFRFFPQVATTLAMAMLVIMAMATLPAPLRAQSPRPDLPDPIKFLNTYNQVFNMTRAVMEEMGLSIELEDRNGKITTRPYEFITGTLTAAEVEKVAVRKDTLTGNWLKARYTVEAVIEIVSPKETMISVHANIEALRRDVDGTEKWIPLDSLGTVERRVLGRVSVKLLGTDAPAEPRKGFWGQKPQPVEPRRSNLPNPIK